MKSESHLEIPQYTIALLIGSYGSYRYPGKGTLCFLRGVGLLSPKLLNSALAAQALPRPLGGSRK